MEAKNEAPPIDATHGRWPIAPYERFPRGII
jgi:hypothetical protein